MPTWRLDLAWDGRDFVGWQRQPAGRSVQAEVERALSRLLGGEAVTVRASGRTDAGVHAAHQVAVFSSEVERSEPVVRAGLDALLPRDIACLSAARVPADFDPRRWVTKKLYRYRILNRQARCPFREAHTWHLRDPIDVEAMDAGAALLVGTHNFTSFRAEGCSAEHPVRHLPEARVVQVGDEVHLEFTGNGFLRHQVRIMTGTLVDVGKGRTSAGEVGDILAARQRHRAGRTAPPGGLWLVRVEIGPGPRLARRDPEG